MPLNLAREVGRGKRATALNDLRVTYVNCSIQRLGECLMARYAEL